MGELSKLPPTLAHFTDVKFAGPPRRCAGGGEVMPMKMLTSPRHARRSEIRCQTPSCRLPPRRSAVGSIMPPRRRAGGRGRLQIPPGPIAGMKVAVLCAVGLINGFVHAPDADQNKLQRHHDDNKPDHDKENVIGFATANETPRPDRPIHSGSPIRTV